MCGTNCRKNVIPRISGSPLRNTEKATRALHVSRCRVVRTKCVHETVEPSAILMSWGFLP